MRALIVALAAFFVAAASPAFAWTQIAERIVTDRMDVDVVTLPGGMRFRQIKICVYRNPVRFVDLDIRYANGANDDIPVRARINPRGCTRDIDLRGADRDIASIKLVYEETSWGPRKTATVRIFGR
jgi:hypothetical protein